MDQRVNHENENRMTEIDNTILLMLDPETPESERESFALKLLCQIATTPGHLEISEESKEALSAHSGQISIIGMPESIDSPELLTIVVNNALGFRPQVEEFLNNYEYINSRFYFPELVKAITNLNITESPNLPQRRRLIQQYYATAANTAYAFTDVVLNRPEHPKAELIHTTGALLDRHVEQIWAYAIQIDLALPIDGIAFDTRLYFGQTTDSVVFSPFKFFLSEHTPERATITHKEYEINERTKKGLYHLASGNTELRMQGVTELLKASIDIAKINPKISSLAYRDVLQTIAKCYSKKAFDRSDEKIYIEKLYNKVAYVLDAPINSQILVVNLMSLLHKFIENQPDLKAFAQEYVLDNGITVVDRLLLYYFRNQTEEYDKFAKRLISYIPGSLN